MDANDSEVYTQNTEKTWMHAKCKLERQFAKSRALFLSYFHEFVFHNHFHNGDFFNNFIADNYDTVGFSCL